MQAQVVVGGLGEVRWQVVDPWAKHLPQLAILAHTPDLTQCQCNLDLVGAGGSSRWVAFE